MQEQGYIPPMGYGMVSADPWLDRLAETISAIATNGFAEKLCEWLRGSCGFDNVAIVAFFQDRRPEVFFARATEERVFERIDSDYVGGAYLLDPFYNLHKEVAPEGLYRLADVAPDQFHRNEYFATYYRRTTLVDELAFLAHPAPGVSITVCIGRDATTAAKFSARDLSTTRQMASIVNALVAMNWRDLRSGDATAHKNIVEILRNRLLEDQGVALSPRQSEVAFLILQGHSSTSIGLNLGISPQTVKVIRKQLYKKCRITSQGELYYLLGPFLSDLR